MNIILMGPQGSGKGTMAQRVEDEFGWPQISTGELLREEEAKGTRLGKWIGSLIDRGKIVPSRAMTKILKKRLGKKDCAKGFQLDGYPRNVPNFNELKKYLRETGKGIDLVIFLRLSKKTAVKRLGSRVQCEKCERIFNLLTLKPRRKGICDKCGGKLVQRTDDRPEAIAKRFKIFHKETLPIFRLLKKEFKSVEINANLSVAGEYASVRREIRKVLRESRTATT